MHIYTHVHVCVHVYIYIYMFISLLKCTHACVHGCISTHICVCRLLDIRSLKNRPGKAFHYQGTLATAKEEARMGLEASGAGSSSQRDDEGLIFAVWHGYFLSSNWVFLENVRSLLWVTSYDSGIPSMWVTNQTCTPTPHPWMLKAGLLFVSGRSRIFWPGMSESAVF